MSEPTIQPIAKVAARHARPAGEPTITQVAIIAAQCAAALKTLAEYGSHAALGEADVQPIEAAFRVRLPLEAEPVNVHPKGVLNPNLPQGALVRVIGGWSVAEYLAQTFGVQYEAAMGRGRAFRNAMASLTEALPMMAPIVARRAPVWLPDTETDLRAAYEVLADANTPDDVLAACDVAIACFAAWCAEREEAPLQDVIAFTTKLHAAVLHGRDQLALRD